MAATAQRLGPVDVKGGLWGGDLLAALAEDRTKLPKATVTPASYGLPARASTEQAARAAWTVLTAAWEEFTELHTARVERDGTDTYGQDRFTHDTWLVHLLDQLGYSPQENPLGGLIITDPDSDTGDGDRFSITHLHAGQVPLHLLAAGVPLDTRTTGVAGAHRQSPHSLVQDYLNRTSQHLWAIVTNGLTLRILRDNAALSRQAYIEFNLAAIFNDGAYADFALLWHAVHATRFTHDPDAGPATCIAERWQDHATATGVAALDDLRDGVEAAIAEIGQGLLEHPANTALRQAIDEPADPFDAMALYRELLYVAYRHVFWFTLDDRDLLHPPDAERTRVATYRQHYASGVLRSKARAHLGAHHPDGWQHHTTVAGWFATPDGQPALALPGLLGRLWDPAATAHLNDTTLTNRRYYEAVRRLAYITRDGALQRINYDALGSEELGAVYEALLEIRPTADTNTRRFTLGRTAGSERKKTGSYYTPTSLIKVLLDGALDPVLDERSKRAVHELPADATPEQRRHAQEQAVLTTTVCDPAMGSAHFLVAAGMRIAKRLAQLRTDEIEPSPEATQHAFRDVASRCLYGVDLNPMAVELAKVAIWLECHVPGQPLTFLDHHFKTGNALLGVGFDPDLIAWHRTAKRAADQNGVPDAAFKPLAGDDKAHARLLRERNKTRRAGGGAVRFRTVGAHLDRLVQLADRSRNLTELADNTPEGLAAKQRAWDSYRHDPELVRQRLRADAWMACWSFPKTPETSEPLISTDPLAGDDLPWDVYYDTFLDDELDLDRSGIRAVRDETQRLGFFHWHLEFAEIAAEGGFGLMLGNPPWEHTELKEKEWFAATGYDDIADAANAAARKRRIDALRTSDDPVDRDTARRWQLDSRDAQSISEFARIGARFPFGGVGRVNTYALFADHFTRSVAPWGRVGIIVPTGLITDYSYRDFFAHLVDERRLAAAYDFINKRGFFPEVAPMMRFTTLIATAPGGSLEARFAFMVLDPTELADGERSYTLTPGQIALVNPNTKTAPVFLTPRDAEITTKIYQRHPVLIHHGHEDGNPWGITFRQGLFNMASDSGLFQTADELRADGWTLNGNIFERDGERMLPLYEAKFFTHFDHREKDYAKTESDKLFVSRAYAYPFDRHEDPAAEAWPRYWVPARDVLDRLASHADGAILAWQMVTASTNARTVVACLLPPVGANHANLIFLGRAAAQTWLVAMMSSFAFDFLARCKLTGLNFNLFHMEQMPVPNRASACQTIEWGKSSVHDWIVSRAVALSATSFQLAEALGLPSPVRWEPARRGQWRVELEAAVFHLYGYSRDEVDYVMDTFPIVARKDRQAEGLADDDPNWRTKRLILAKYDELAEHARAGTTYVSPDPPPPLPEKLRLSAVSEAGGA